MGDDGVKLVAQVAQVAGGLAGDDVGDGLEQALAVLDGARRELAQRKLLGVVADLRPRAARASHRPCMPSLRDSIRRAFVWRR